jgi:hypothetical protein
MRQIASGAVSVLSLLPLVSSGTLDHSVIHSALRSGVEINRTQNPLNLNHHSSAFCKAHAPLEMLSMNLHYISKYNCTSSRVGWSRSLNAAGRRYMHELLPGQELSVMLLDQ